jgi:AmiR/NasT family two-component response regulator
MVETEAQPLRVLLAADEQNGPSVAPLFHGLGFEVVADAQARPDLVIVGPGLSRSRAHELIERSTPGATRPVIAFLSEADDLLIDDAAKAGVSAYIVGDDRDSWPKLVEAALRPFRELRDLEAALRRRAVIERAKGILMERNGVRESEAFDLLRAEARSTNHRVVDVASDVLGGHRLLSRDEALDRGGRA